MDFSSFKLYPNVNYDMFNRQFLSAPKDDFDFLSKEEQEDVLHFRESLSTIYKKLIIREFTGKAPEDKLSKIEEDEIIKCLNIFAPKFMECKSIQIQTMHGKTLSFSFKFDDLDISSDLSIEDVTGNFFFVDGGVPAFQPAVRFEGYCYIFIPAETYTVVFKFLESEYEAVANIWKYFIDITKLDFQQTHFINVPVNLSNTLKVYNLFKEQFKVYPVRLAFKLGDDINVNTANSLSTR